MFYKYRSDSEFTDQIFKSRQVYLATAEGLNDPFECSLQDIGRDWIAEKVLEMKQAGVAGFLLTAKMSMDNKESFFGYSGSQIEDILNSVRNHSGIEETYAFYVEFIREHTGQPPSDCNRFFSGIDAQLNSVGIFSMSKRPDHPLMWAHYAGEHTGICIGFEATKNSKMEHPEHFLPVNYSDSLPELNDDGFQAAMTMSMGAQGRVHTSSFKIAFSDKTFQAAITTKPTCWRYEEEWRYIEPYPGLFDWPGRISELTFGLKCSDERQEHFVRLAEKHIPNEVSLYEIRKKHGTNALERCRYGMVFP